MIIRPLLLLAIAVTLGTADLQALEKHPAKGIVLQVDTKEHAMLVSCDAIPGYMDAMEMSLTVHDARVLTAIVPGSTIKFNMVEQGTVIYAEDVELASTNFETEPMVAGRLAMLRGAINPAATTKIIQLGQRVPDFTLTDQAEKRVELSQFTGKIVALTFAYSRCPNPNYCFRLSNNLWRLSKRFHDRTGRDLVLLTIVINPEHDQGAALVQYADIWKADPKTWHFLTGPMPEVQKIAEYFGMNFWNDEALLTHSFHTVVIDRKGLLAANLEGNQFTAEQLGDLVQTVIDQPQ